MASVKSVYFVREFPDEFQPERKMFLSRPKLDGLWVRLRFRDEDVMEGIVANDLLDLLDNAVQLTPPDLHGNTLRLFIPRSALAEMKVLGVVGAARRTPRAAGARHLRNPNYSTNRISWVSADAARSAPGCGVLCAAGVGLFACSVVH